MLARWPTSETEVAAPVVAWLRAAGWDVYQEVRQRRHTGCSCDIIATRGPLVWAVEAKVRLNVNVIDQARYWSAFTHYASVAVPYRAARDVNSVFSLALNTWGIGMFGVRDPESMHLRDAENASRAAQAVTRERSPRLNRHANPANLRKALCEEHKTFLAAGSPCGGGWTPYKATCAALLDLVQQHPGCTLREAIAGRKPTIDGDIGWPGIKHHYHTDSTAIGSLRMWISEGKVLGVRMERDGRQARLFPVAEECNDVR